MVDTVHSFQDMIWCWFYLPWNGDSIFPAVSHFLSEFIPQVSSCSITVLGMNYLGHYYSQPPYESIHWGRFQPSCQVLQSRYIYSYEDYLQSSGIRYHENLKILHLLHLFPWISTNSEQHSQSVQHKLIPGHLSHGSISGHRKNFPSFLFTGYQSLSQAAKCLKQKWDRSPPSRVKVRNAWSFTSSIFSALCSWVRPILSHLHLCNFIHELIHN